MFSIKRVDETTILLVGGVSVEKATDVSVLIQEHVRNKPNSELSIDLSELETVSSVMLSLLLCGLRAAKEVSCNLRYINISQDLFNMARVSGIESILLKSEA